MNLLSGILLLYPLVVGAQYAVPGPGTVNTAPAPDPKPASNGDPPQFAGLWPHQRFKTQPTFFPPVFDYVKYGETAPGYLFLSPQGAGGTDFASLIMTNEGELIWQNPITDTLHPQPAELDGKPVLLNWAGVHLPTKRTYGSVHILDESYNMIHRVTLDYNHYLDNDIEGVKLPDSWINMHEARLTKNGTLMVMGTNATLIDLTSVGGPAEGWVWDFMIYEIDVATNDVLWYWAPLEHQDQIPLTSSLSPLGKFGKVAEDPWDWFHMNSIVEYGEGFIISGRHTCSIYYISKATGRVIWTLSGPSGGDFKRLDGDAEFKYQHTASVIPISDSEIHMTIHNNNNWLPEERFPTSGLRISVNLDEMTFKTVKKYYDPEYLVYSWAEGSYETLSNGNVILNHGRTPMAFEYDEEGHVLYRTTFGSDVSSYRVYRKEFVGKPNTLPDVAACTTRYGDTQVFMSWNGATEYTSWNVYCSGGNWPEVSVPRRGFESNVTLDCPVSVQVEAMFPDGTGMKSRPLALQGVPDCDPYENDMQQVITPHRSHHQALP